MTAHTTCQYCGGPLTQAWQRRYCSHTCANRARVLSIQEAPLGYMTLTMLAVRTGWTRTGLRSLVISHRLRAEWDGGRRLISVAEVERAEQRGVFTKRQAKEQGNGPE